SSSSLSCALFFFPAPAPPEFYTLSLHDALPISCAPRLRGFGFLRTTPPPPLAPPPLPIARSPGSDTSSRRPPTSTTTVCRGMVRSEEHTSELQSLAYLVCRLLLEKKKKKNIKMK